MDLLLALLNLINYFAINIDGYFIMNLQEQNRIDLIHYNFLSDYFKCFFSILCSDTYSILERFCIIKLQE
ncbi:hypothetical protein BpHYR1_013847 [Brachionus plicatilis]|uniref:Uncharacterized protein n=1 Tax=Brachionus plicatilis TaxID=10195 RepID=A0A3M7QC67_BRAPC|nr:hypothetical protein BpHYR1_013847 [Brachionus plicatilis]